tara:strand:+ start:423 stop:671 length:249 start_codon:yes stop_codon:yes gene_type:complete
MEVRTVAEELKTSIRNEIKKFKLQDKVGPENLSVMMNVSSSSIREILSGKVPGKTVRALVSKYYKTNESILFPLIVESNQAA